MDRSAWGANWLKDTAIVGCGLSEGSNNGPDCLFIAQAARSTAV